MDFYLEQLLRELEETMTVTSSQAMDKGPAGKWTPAEIFEHLFLTYHHTNKGLVRCLEKGMPLGTRSTLRHRLSTLLVINLAYYPKGRKAPERAVPKGMSADEVRHVILPELQRMDASFAECERRFGAGVKILDHPILGPFNVGQWRKFHWVHGRHHTRQIRERLGKVSV
jgi:hypothetical protein